MEPNLRFGIWERQSFVQRFLRWTELLDPTNLLISIERIEKSRQLLFTNEDAARHNLNDQRIKEAWKRSLSTVHPDSSRLIPAFFRPAAFLPLTAPMRRHGAEQVVLGTGAFSSSAFLGLFPYFIQTKCPLINPLIKRALPIIFFAQVSAMNVFASRSLEPIRGIQVMDKEGRVIGLSRKAGEKAVRETSISRAVLFGISALIPEVFTYFYKRTLFYLENPWSLWTAKLSCTVLVMGLMVPVSFSMFPQVGRVQSRKLEEEIQSSTEETELFYNRGV
ncbi:sideroflexin-4 isoform X3 [Dipodomys spectabilis]|uniref:sideroflexin-4 isoform X3 n=1 Tax=Dipodomys spectabilis TaxID=105255 RepID=UPI001C53CB4C|nr:sideroflexin-4 isoform X3 [Dipodomys spectabilis]